MEKLIKIQFWVLLLGTVFAWGNFAREIYNLFVLQTTCSQTTCVSPIALGVSVGGFSEFVGLFMAPCFWGAVFFTAAFALNVIARRRAGNQAGV